MWLLTKAQRIGDIGVYRFDDAQDRMVYVSSELPAITRVPREEKSENLTSDLYDEELVEAVKGFQA